jgi:1-acyl-sn-glycerol-3-phosphate acyltransferase
MGPIMARMAPMNLPALGPAIPRRGWRWGRALGRFVMATARWGFDGEVPNISKGVIIVAPHTSNWDFVIGAAAMLALDLRLRFLGKHTLFSGPLAPMMRGLGGIPVDRTQPGRGVVEEMAERFKNENELLLALAPEGTRSSVDRWKTGFHRIACAAHVPIMAVALDYEPRKIRFGPLVNPSADIDRDIGVFLDFFATARGRRGNPGPTVA